MQETTELKKEKISQVAKRYALHCHKSTNHKYDGKPYSYHLKMVVAVAKRFMHLLPNDETIRENVLGGCWTHDVAEDCRQTLNDVKKATNEEVAELAYALTNEKGRNRAERANDKYYEGIRKTPYATFIKLCDRIANAQHSRETGSRMLDMYRKENVEFENKIWDVKYEEMFQFLRNILK